MSILTKGLSPDGKKLVIEIHATQLRSATCERLLWLNIIEELRANHLYNDTLFGTCFHKFTEVFSETEGNLALATLQAQNTWREKSSDAGFRVKDNAKHLDISRLTLDCHKWVDWQKDDKFTILTHNGFKLVEFSYHIPLYSDDKLDILLSGTMDKVTRHRNSGVYAVGDYKTTRSYDKDSYFRKYLLDPQPITYVYAIHQYAKMQPDSVFAEIVNSGTFGFFIDGIFLTSKETSFERSRLFQFSDSDLVEYDYLLASVVMKLRHLITQLKVGIPMYREGRINGSCSNFGGCGYYAACQSGDNGMFENVINQYFTKKKHEGESEE